MSTLSWAATPNVGVHRSSLCRGAEFAPSGGLKRSDLEYQVALVSPLGEASAQPDHQSYRNHDLVTLRISIEEMTIPMEVEGPSSKCVCGGWVRGALLCYRAAN